MKIVDSIPGRSRYPWAEWFDGQVRLLESGVDYDGEGASVRSMAYTAAKKAGVKVVIRVREEGVYLQAIKPRVVPEKGNDGGDDSHRAVA